MLNLILCWLRYVQYIIHFSVLFCFGYMLSTKCTLLAVCIYTDFCENCTQKVKYFFKETFCQSYLHYEIFLRRTCDENLAFLIFHLFIALYRFVGHLNCWMLAVINSEVLVAEVKSSYIHIVVIYKFLNLFFSFLVCKQYSCFVRWVQLPGKFLAHKGGFIYALV